MTPEAACAGLIDDMGRFSRDPLGWVYYSFPWGEPGTTLAGADGPDAWQRDILREIKARFARGGLDNEMIRLAVASGHGIGKSALVAWLILWSLSTFPDTMGVVTANTGTQLKTKTWAELTRWYQLFIARHWFRMAATSIQSAEAGHAATWRFDALTWSKENSEAFAGLHNQGRRIVVIFDEASAIDRAIWEVVEGAMTDRGTEKFWFAFGNPTRNTGRFADCFFKRDSAWEHRQIDSRTAKMTDKAQLDQWIEQYGIDSDFIKVRVLGQFPNASSMQLIPISLVERGFERWHSITEQEFSFAPRILGVDVARYGDDTSRIALRQGLNARLLWSGGKIGLMAQAEIIAALEDTHKTDATFIDAGGVGGGVIDRLRQLNRHPIEINFQSKPIDPRFANKRAEMWWLLREWLEQSGALPDEDQNGKKIADEVRSDLIAPEYFFTAAGKILLESKEDMKSRGLESPDIGDALALTFAAPVAQRVRTGAYYAGDDQPEWF